MDTVLCCTALYNGTLGNGSDLLGEESNIIKQGTKVFKKNEIITFGTYSPCYIDRTSRKSFALRHRCMIDHMVVLDDHMVCSCRHA